MTVADNFSLFRQYHDKEQLIEEVIRVFYSAFLSPLESVAIDCGSHNGLHTMPLAECCKQVIGIDANLEISAGLAEKTRVANLNNCRIIHAAVQDDENLSKITFYVADEFLGRSSLTRLWDVIDEKVIYRPVVSPATTLDRLVEDMALGRVDFIKLDLEGGEYKALRGAERLLKRDLPVFVMENSIHAAKQGGFLATDPFDYLSGLGYVLLTPDGSTVTRDSLFPFWYLFGVPLEVLDKYRNYLMNSYACVCASKNII